MKESSRKISEWTKYRIYWDIFTHLGLIYKKNIQFSKKYEKLIRKHVDILKAKDSG